MTLTDALVVYLGYEHTAPGSLKPEEEALRWEAVGIIHRRKMALLTERYPHLTLEGRLGQRP